jgi:hypothetical protein
MANIYGMAKSFTGGLLAKGQAVLDSLFPPEKRAELLTKLQSFAVANPKLSAFLLSNIALTGLPLLMFIVFTITVFVFSFVAALLVGLLAAILFTAFAVGLALLLVLPTVFITTMGATFLFLWGLGGYYILKWFNEGQSPAAEGTAMGDKINNLMGGRLDFLMDGARSGEAVGVGKNEGAGEEKPKGNEESESDHGEKGAVSDGTPPKGATKAVSSATKNADAGKVTSTTAGAQKKAGTTTSTAKGAASVATGQS